MPLTVGHVAALPDLGLLVRAASASMEREVRWVAVSEHLDPTPWIEPGDLVLTTGMSLNEDDGTCREYVARLVAADAAGLGFGVGFRHATVPEGIIEAAEEAGFPLLEVPQPVPFVAVGKAVSRLLTTEEYADAAASFEAQRRMIRAVLNESGRADADVIAALARHVGGFALHLDSTGALITASPDTAAGRVAELADEIDRLRPRGLLASSSIASADEHMVIVPIGVKGAAEGFLVVGSTRPLRSADQSVMNLAVSLLSWAASQPLVMESGMDPWRRLLLTFAAEHGLDAALLGELGLDGLDPTRAVAVTLRPRPGLGVPDATVTALQRSGEAMLAGRRGGDVVGFLAVEHDGSLPLGLRTAASAPEVQAVGVSCVLDLTDPANVRQAMEQADHAVALGSGLKAFAEEPSRGLASLLDAATTAMWAHAYLADLMAAPEGAELMDTVRAWLAHHGQVDAAAQELGIHRHTVRHRLRRAEALLGRTLEDPAVRADLWFALGAVRAAASDDAASR